MPSAAEGEEEDFGDFETTTAPRLFTCNGAEQTMPDSDEQFGTFARPVASPPLPPSTAAEVEGAAPSPQDARHVDGELMSLQGGAFVRAVAARLAAFAPAVSATAVAVTAVSLTPLTELLSSAAARMSTASGGDDDDVTGRPSNPTALWLRTPLYTTDTAAGLVDSTVLKPAAERKTPRRHPAVRPLGEWGSLLAERRLVVRVPSFSLPPSSPS